MKLSVLMLLVSIVQLSYSSGTKVVFINGYPYKTFYMLGDLAYNEYRDINPFNNDYEIKFDKHGTATFQILEEELIGKDFDGYGNKDSLDLILVETPGSHDTFSYFGMISIGLSAKREGAVLIDLFEDKPSGKISPLIIEFINAPNHARGSKYYVAGELLLNEYNIDNPGIEKRNGNKYEVSFDLNGRGYLTVEEKIMNNGIWNGWGLPRTIELLLVEKPGEWEKMKDLYTDSGLNSIDITYNKFGKAVIDLSKLDAKGTIKY